MDGWLLDGPNLNKRLVPVAYFACEGWNLDTFLFDVDRDGLCYEVTRYEGTYRPHADTVLVRIAECEIGSDVRKMHSIDPAYPDQRPCWDFAREPHVGAFISVVKPIGSVPALHRIAHHRRLHRPYSNGLLLRFIEGHRDVLQHAADDRDALGF